MDEPRKPCTGLRYIQAEATERAMMGDRVKDGIDLAPIINPFWPADPPSCFAFWLAVPYRIRPL